MHFITWPTVRSLFQLSCFASLIFMTSYWFYKFVIEDEDLCLVDYKAVENADEFPLPTVSMCFENPFLDKKLKEIGPDINTTTYLKYLRGEIFDGRFSDIDYDSVTLNLSEYHIKDIVYWKNGSISSSVLKNNVVEQLYVTFNGFWDDRFYKCFGMEINNKYRGEINYIGNVYKQNEFLDGFRRSSGNALCIFFHYPTHFLLSNMNYKWFAIDALFEWFQFTSSFSRLQDKCHT